MSLTKATYSMIRGAPVNVLDYGADATGSTDSTAAIQLAITAGRKVIFPTGATFLVANGTNISIPANTKLVIEKGCTINTTARWTAYNVNNVEWQIDGIFNVTAIGVTPQPAITGWPSVANGLQIASERGFIEFGGADYTATPSSGFWVHGTGKVTGYWTGTAGVGDLANQLNRKGIAVWNAANVMVEDIEIYGFEGEQVYAFVNFPECSNIVFRHIYSHDCKFNCLNFNVGNVIGAGAYRNLRIINNMTLNGYTGIEASAGVIQDNYVSTPSMYGIWFGLGAGAGPITVCGNTVYGASSGYLMSFSSSLATPVLSTSIHDNLAIDCAELSFAFNKLTYFTVKNNQSRGHAQSIAGQAYYFTNCTYGWVDGNVTNDPGPSSSGNVASVNSIIEFGSNPVIIGTGGTAATANGTGYGVGGTYATTTTYGNRENQFAVWASDMGAVGAGPEYTFKTGSAGNTTFAAISGIGVGYDGAGATGGVGIACVKSSSSVVLPTLAISWSVDGKMNLFQATTAAAPTYAKGGMYFDTTLNKVRIGGATAWETVTSA